MPRIASHVRELPVVLTNDELLARHQELSQVMDAIEAEESALETTKKQYQARIKALEQQRDELRDIVRAKAELRDVVVDVIFDIAADRVFEVRSDTGETINEREPTSDERQIPMFPEADDPAAGE